MEFNRGGAKLFAGLYLAVLIPAMWVVSDGVVDIASLASFPVIAVAEAIVFAMLFAVTYYSEDPAHQHATPSLKMSVLEAHEPVLQRK